MSEKPMHTSAPWHVGPHYTHDVESREGRVCECGPMGSPRAVANAEFIVRACNSHDELLDACHCVLELDQVADILAGNETLRDLLEEVIKKAEPPS